MSYESYTLGLHIPNRGSQRESPIHPREPYGSQCKPIMANLGDLNPFWAGPRLLCIETLVEFLRLGFY